MDGGISQANSIQVSRAVNGDVDMEKLNGLDLRLQSVLFLRDVLLDHPANKATEAISFLWRRNSEKEPTGLTLPDGAPKRAFILRSSPWVIDVPLEKQRQ